MFWNSSGPSTGMSPSTGTFSIRKVLVNGTCCTVRIMRATKMANAGANMLMAVPLITWSAFILMAA